MPPPLAHFPQEQCLQVVQNPRGQHRSSGQAQQMFQREQNVLNVGHQFGVHVPLEPPPPPYFRRIKNVRQLFKLLLRLAQLVFLLLNIHKIPPIQQLWKIQTILVPFFCFISATEHA